MKAWLTGDDLSGYVIVWAETAGKARYEYVRGCEFGVEFTKVRVRRAPNLDGEPRPDSEITDEEFVLAGGSLDT